MFLLSIATLFVAAHGCEDGWFSYQESCYVIVEKNEPWPFAVAFCNSLGGYLLQLETQEENEFIKNYTRKLHASQDQRPFHYLIGGHDIVREGHWIWAHTHEEFDYTDWAPGEPNSQRGDQDCMQIQGSQDYQWDDIECDVSHYFICETGAVNQTNSPMVVGR